MVRCRIDRLHVDFLRSRDTHDRNVLRRRGKSFSPAIASGSLRRKNLIIMKLKVGRDRDFDDARRIISQHRRGLNRTYLRRWTGKLGITSEFAYVMGE